MIGGRQVTSFASRASPLFVGGHVSSHVQPYRNVSGRQVAVVDLSEERPILEPVHGHGQPVTVDDVANFAKDSRRQLAQQPPLRIVEIHRCACHLFGTLGKPDLVTQLARDRAIVVGHFPQPKTRPLHRAIDDLAPDDHPVRNVLNKKTTLAFHDGVLQRDNHGWRLLPATPPSAGVYRGLLGVSEERALDTGPAGVQVTRAAMRRAQSSAEEAPLSTTTS